jgi:hypothetical protein
MMHTPVTPDFVKTFAAGTLEIHCSKVVLRQNGDPSGHSYSGPGLITLAEDRETFSIRIYSDVHDPVESLMRHVDEANWMDPGVILPPQAYYSLEATSMEGHVWTFPHVRITPYVLRTGTMIVAQCPRLFTTAQPARVHEGETWHLVCFSDLDIPLNRVINRKAVSGDKVLSETGTLGRAELVNDGVHFEFEKLEDLPGATELICRSPAPLPIAFGQRVQEALRLVTFSPVAWSVSQQNRGGVVSVVLTATPEIPSGVLPSPIPTERGMAEDFWKLFGLYLDHVCRHPDSDTTHRLSANLKPLLSLQKLQVESVALGAGVATEAILNSEHAEIGNPPSTLLRQLDYLVQVAQRVKCEDPNLRRRVVGTLSMMKSRRAKDALVFLRDRGVITADQYKAWDSLRNSSAHAGVIDSENLQARITECFKVYELILILVFLAVGYTGSYRQTSLPGWPIGKFERNAADLVPPDVPSGRPCYAGCPSNS